MLAIAIGAFFGGVEALLTLTLRVRSAFCMCDKAHQFQGPYDRGVAWPMILTGVIAAILLGAGLLPPYFELWKRGGRVVGISK